MSKLADLAVLSQNIFTVSNEDLPKTESVLKLLEGRLRTPMNRFSSSSTKYDLVRLTELRLIAKTWPPTPSVPPLPDDFVGKPEVIA
jgi:hypothetical protein